MSLEQLLLLGLTGLAAGWIDAIAGGGGLLTVPVLLGLGLPPATAFGTNKMQSSVGTAVAVWRYALAGWLRGQPLALLIAVVALASALGAWAVTVLDPHWLRRLVPWLLMLVALQMALSPGLGREPSKQRLRWPLFVALAGLGLGFYDGFFGPGTGAFWAMAWMMGRGKTMEQATALTKVVNLTSNLGSLLIFIAAGQVLWSAAAVMIVGQIGGAALGAGFALRHGRRWIRPLLLLVVLALVLRLLWS